MGPRPSNNLRPLLPRAVKTSSKATIDQLNNLDLSNTEDLAEDLSTIIYEVPPIHNSNLPDLNTLTALLAQENTEPQNKKDLRLNTLLSLMAKVTLTQANPTEPFEPRNFKEAMADYDHDK